MDETTEHYDTVTMAPTDTLRFNILYVRNNLIEEFRIYEYNEGRGAEGKAYRVSSRFKALLRHIGQSYRESQGDDKFTELYKMVESAEYDGLLAAYWVVEEFLYKKRLTQYDTAGGYDRTRLKSVVNHFKKRGY